jgi:hypothetical protein
MYTHKQMRVDVGECVYMSNVCIWQARLELQRVLKVPQNSLEIVGSGFLCCFLLGDLCARRCEQKVPSVCVWGEGMGCVCVRRGRETGSGERMV